VTIRSDAIDRDSLPVCHCAAAGRASECTAASPRFVVRSFVSGPKATEVARHCEAVCSNLRSEVFHLPNEARWQPKCQVVLHASRGAYERAVGPGSGQTVGTSNITFAGGRVTQRRIDLLASDGEQELSALPHELVHVLFADVCPTTAPPKWAEEGLALVMDPAEKQARHRRDLEAAIRSRSTLPISRLLADENYPTLAERAAFYGQSLSLVEYLMRQRKPAEFVRFVKLSAERGADRALADVYRLNARELEADSRLYSTSTSLAGVE
jgi:hypothetical protein